MNIESELISKTVQMILSLRLFFKTQLILRSKHPSSLTVRRIRAKSTEASVCLRLVVGFLLGFFEKMKPFIQEMRPKLIYLIFPGLDIRCH